MYNLENINDDWCQFVMNHCDFSNIHRLTLYRDIFNGKLINESGLKKFALKFINLKKLIISFYKEFDPNVLLLWQLLNPIMSKNNCTVEVSIFGISDGQLDTLKTTMSLNNLKITKLNLHLIQDDIDKNISNYSWREFIEKIENGDFGLKHVKIDNAIEDTVNTLNIYLVKRISFNKINVLEIKNCYNSPLDDVNKFLELNIIFDKKVFVISHFGIDYTKQKENVSLLFPTLCDNICTLFAAQIAVDIKIEFRYINHNQDDHGDDEKDDETIFDQCLSIYSSYFQDKNIMFEYKKPKCENYLCLPRAKPFSFLQWKEEKFEESFLLRATNVEYV